MDPSLIHEPVSSVAPAFRQLVGEHVQNGEAIVVQFRYSYSGGARDYFLVREQQQFDELVAGAQARTSITVFFESGFLKGNVCYGLRDSAISLLHSVKTEVGGVYIIRLDGTGSSLDQDHLLWLTEEEEITDWFAKRSSTPVLIGALKFWDKNNPNTVTVYVPDADGIVRPGAY